MYDSLVISTINKDRKMPILHGVDSHYPDIDKWLKSLVPGDETPIITVERNGIVVGICIGKNTIEEKKLRCVRVHEDYQNSGIGIRMIDKMMDIIQCDKPLCTVPEEQLHQFSRMFINRYGYSLDEVNKGMYRKGKLEYVFNK